MIAASPRQAISRTVLGACLLAVPAIAEDESREFVSFRHDVRTSSAWEVLPTADGFLWFASDAGLFRFDGLRSEIIHLPPELGRSSVYALAESADGSVWAGTHGGGLARYFKGTWTTYRVPRGPLWNRIWEVIVGTEGVIWVGSEAGLASLHDGQWRQYTSDDGIASGPIWALAEVPGEGLWAGSSGGLSLVSETGVSLFGADDGLAHTYVSSLAVGDDGSLWVGSNRSSITLRRDGSFLPVGRLGGVPRESVEVIFVDGVERLWLGSEGDGLWEAPLDVSGLPHHAVDWSDRVDGLISDIRSDELGRIWIASEERGLFQTAGSAEGEPSPRVVLTEVRVDNIVLAKPHDDGTWLVQAPSRSLEVEVQYSLLGVTDLANWSFESSVDDGVTWIDQQGRRAMTLRLPGHGEHRIRLAARESRGTRIETSEVLRIHVAPALLERTSVRFLALVTLAGVAFLLRALLGAYRGSRRRELEAVVSERTAELRDTQSELLRLARTDGLTGLANRRRFDEALLDSWRQAADSGELIALLLLDIDHFKNYNDRLGHLAGDEVLRAVAGQIESHVRRSTDLVARYGGEEFVVLLPGWEVSAAFSRAETIREGVEHLQIPHPESSAAQHVTVSVGVAAMAARPGANAQALVRRADEALYQAKAVGRNRVQMSSANA